MQDPSSLMKNFAGLAERYSTVETMFRGGYPEALERPEELVSKYFDDYLHMYLERDALYANASAASPKFMQYFGLVAALTAQESNHESLMKKLGISRLSVQQWNHVLKQTYQWREVKPYSNNLSQRLVKKSKGYITDTVLAAFVQGIREPLSLLNSPLSGAFREEHGNQVEHGLVLYPGDHPIAISEHATILPFNARMKPREVGG